MSGPKKYPWDETGVGQTFLVPVPEGVKPTQLQNRICAAARSRRKRSVIMGRPSEHWTTEILRDEEGIARRVAIHRVS